MVGGVTKNHAVVDFLYAKINGITIPKEAAYFEALGVRPAVSQFVIPLGATINMNGTALYQGVAAIFLAQVFGVELGTGALTLIVLTAVGASIGSPATPGVGIV